MNPWESLVSAALIGTDRRPFTPDALPGIQPDELDAAGAEARVLACAAVLATYRRAGWSPSSHRIEITAPAPDEDLPECSPTAAQVLELLLAGDVRVDGGNHPLISQWLVACANAGRRVPARLLVAVLRLGTTKPTTRQHVRAVIGTRGEWLAAQNPQWTWARRQSLEPRTAAERFATMTSGERLTLLTAARSIEPALGRTLVESIWDGEQAASRAGMVDALATGLSQEDEPLLETTLDDRAASVRAAAARLLDQLPRSRRAARMADRVRSLVRVDDHGRGITVELPDEPDPAARRDGITDERERGYGLRASWLIKMLRATPLTVWESELGLRPTEAVLLGADHAELIYGWGLAAHRQGNREWASAIAARVPEPWLLPVLGPAAAADVVAGYPNLDARFAALLDACPDPWPAGFSAAITERLRSAAGTARRLVNVTLPTLGAHLHPATLPVVEAWIAEVPDEQAPRRALRDLAHALTIRHTITQEFS